jgi:thioredoxin-like negative regulator of GroEL
VRDIDTPMQISATVAGTVIGIPFLGIGAGVATILGFDGWSLVGIALLTGVVAGATVRNLSLGVANKSGAAFLALVQPSGKSSPYEAEFSNAQALVARDDIAGAIALYDAEMQRLPENEIVRVQAAELHARRGDPRRAESLFLEVRRLTSDRGRELYTTQRLIDLRLGVLASPERALPELRRLIDRFPGTPEAAGAASALEKLKRESRERADGDRGA